MINRIKELNKILHDACEAYYVKDNPIMTDKEYDKLYDELATLENRTGFILADSPTQKVQGRVMEGFIKVKHSKPMLSAKKTKYNVEVSKFLDKYHYYASYKMDGLTLVLIYKNGELYKAITRGDGIYGEDVTEQAMMIKNLPIHINYTNELEIRGECVISYADFEDINSKLSAPYKHPRNLAGGSLRNLDTNITRERRLNFIAFEAVRGLEHIDSKYQRLDSLDYLGFETVKRAKGSVQGCIGSLIPEYCKYPTDGLIFEIDSDKISKSLGSTAHHENCRIAYKWADDTYETTLRDVEWDVGRTGIVSPVAVFDPIDLDGAITSRASLHNLSIIENLELGIGDTITVYRANMVIPNVDDNLTRSNNLKIPEKCPCCGKPLGIEFSAISKSLVCTNPDCAAKIIARLTYFSSKSCLDIDGLSDKTVRKLVETGIISDFKSLYRDPNVLYDLISDLEGFGSVSASNLVEAIQRSRNCTLDRFITALGIPGIGGETAKALAKVVDYDINKLYNFIESSYDWQIIPGIGKTTAADVSNYFNINISMVKELASEFNFSMPAHNTSKSNSLGGKSFCVTGRLNDYSRDSLHKVISDNGGIVATAVNKKTDYLITNETSGSSKYKKAVELGVRIITEKEFINLIS